MADEAPVSPPPHAAALKLALDRRSELPMLAWALRHVKHADTIQVLAGPGIREAADVFWEGVNPCLDEPRAVIGHHFPLCSGAIVRGDEIVAFTPGHTLDRMFVIERGDTIYVSNSLAFALRVSGTELEPRCLTYHWHLGAIQSYRQTAPLRGGALTIYHNVNLVISKQNETRWEKKPASPGFENYAEYRAGLDAYLQEMARAARDPINGDYTPITTISTGYDSPAASVLAHDVGADTALTIVDARAGGSDSGEEIANIIGLQIEGKSRTEYRQSGIDAERLFYFGGVANDIIFYPWKDRLRSKLLFTGYKGDMLWDRTWIRPLGTWSWDTDGATMIELRLRSGFVHVPPAFYGGRHFAKLLAISKSDEMAPWTLWTEYDRPIARRIVEESRVPRDLFGQTKKMVTSAVGVDRSHKYIGVDDLGLSAEFRDLLRAHRRKYDGPALSLAFAFNNGVHRLMRTAHRAAHALRRALSRGAPAAKPPAQRNRPPTLKERVFFELEFQFPFRRTYMTPFTELNFAAQVSNKLLAADYQEF